jgi:ketosteroid isomerase-like protein
MPWFPDFAGAVELARSQTRATGEADPVGQYFAALNRGDTRALEDVWPGEVVVYDPHAGEVRGHRELRHFVRRSASLLAERRTRVETVASTVVANRAVVELLAHQTIDGREIEWPVAVVAESPDDWSVVFRSYLCRRSIDGQGHVRTPILPAGDIQPGDIVDRHRTALAAGDVDATVSTFESDGYLREAIGPYRTHRGTAELRSLYAAWLRDGGIDQQCCTVTDDGVHCAVEYNCVRWGGRELPVQAGIGVYERDPGGLLAAVRIYDDVDPPIELADS